MDLNPRLNRFLAVTGPTPWIPDNSTHDRTSGLARNSSNARSLPVFKISPHYFQFYYPAFSTLAQRRTARRSLFQSSTSVTRSRRRWRIASLDTRRGERRRISAPFPRAKRQFSRYTPLAWLSYFEHRLTREKLTTSFKFLVVDQITRPNHAVSIGSANCERLFAFLSLAQSHQFLVDARRRLASRSRRQVKRPRSCGLSSIASGSNCDF